MEKYKINREVDEGYIDSIKDRNVEKIMIDIKENKKSTRYFNFKVLATTFSLVIITIFSIVLIKPNGERDPIENLLNKDTVQFEGNELITFSTYSIANLFTLSSNESLNYDSNSFNLLMLGSGNGNGNNNGNKEDNQNGNNEHSNNDKGNSNGKSDLIFEDSIDDVQKYYEILERFVGYKDDSLSNIHFDEDLEEGYTNSYKFKIDGIDYLILFNIVEDQNSEGNLVGVLRVGQNSLEINGLYLNDNNASEFHITARNSETNEYVKLTVVEEEGKTVYKYDIYINGIQSTSTVRVIEEENKIKIMVSLGKGKDKEMFSFTETEIDGVVKKRIDYKINKNKGFAIITEDVEGNIEFEIHENGNLKTISRSRKRNLNDTSNVTTNL